MKRYPGINYSQRPQSYWVDQTVLSVLLRNVKGTERRKLITRCAKQGTVPELSGTILNEMLWVEARDAIGKINRAFLGGEYLPDYANNETEIARIELASTTSDVISIRAQYLPNEIRYRIIDEHETEFDLAFGASRRPLTLEQLINFFEGSSLPGVTGSLALVYNRLNSSHGTRAKVRNFTNISSDLYPQLHEHFERVFDDWVKE
jgi:hypothetical protein